MDSLEDERPAKRFKHQSYKSTLKEVHLPSALSQSKFDHDIEDNDSHFREALEHWRELNLAPAFVKLANDAEALSASMPLLLHNWETIADLWLDALKVADDEALKALLDLFQKLAHDLRTTLAPKYPLVLRNLITLLPRSLSASTLTALLATFSALFKYVLIPAVDAELLQQAWAIFRGTLPQCDPEVQRATAEVWGATLRRLKPAAREVCVELIVGSSEGPLQDACAWAFVFACKSVSQTLHTATASLVGPMLKYHLACASPEGSYTAIRRVLTALIHHCKGPEQFAPVADVLVAQFLECTSACTEEGGEERLRRALEIISIACSVQQGSRMTAKQLQVLLAKFDSIPLTESLHPASLKFIVSILTAGDMALWMSPGRKTIERVWERPILAIELLGTLANLSWGGWKLIALPHVLKRTPELLQTYPHRTLELLATLREGRMLDTVDVVWKQRFQSWVDGILTTWELTEDNVLLLHGILALSSLLPSISPLLIKIIDVALDVPEPQQDYDTSSTNSAWVLGKCLESLSSRPTADWANGIDIVSWTMKVVEKYSWSSIALGSLVSLIRALGSGSQSLSLDALYAHMQSLLLSHSRALRLAALRFLNTWLVESSTGTAEVLKRCLQTEEVPLDLQSSRERVHRISRLPVVIKDDDEVGVDAACRWLIAQLKVNLRPLWAATASALSILAERFGDLVWRLLFEQLQAVANSTVEVNTPEWLKNDDEEQGDKIWEVERTWKDPSGRRLRQVFAKWHSGKAAKKAVAQSQRSDDRFDSASYETQLLLVLRECPSLAERHSRDLIPHFLSLTGPDASTKLPRYKLSAWLTLFSKFMNPKALRSSDTMHALYVSLLSHPDRSLQRLALSCLLTYKSPHLTSHEDILLALLDDTRWRDALTQLEIAEIESADRPELISTIIRLLFGLMLERRGRSQGTDRRAAVLAAFAGCTDDELHLLVDLMLQPISGDVVDSGEQGFAIRAIPTEVSEKQQIGFLTLLGDVLKHLGSRLIARWPVLLQTLLNLANHAQRRIDTRHSTATIDESVEIEDEDEDVDEAEGSSRSMRTVRQLSVKRLADFFRCPVSYDFTTYMREAFPAIISPRLEHLDRENTQAPSALLELFYVWTTQKEYAHILVDYDERTLAKIYACLIAINVKAAVISKVYDIVDNILSLSVEDERYGDTLLKPHVSLLLTNISILVERSKGLTNAADTLGKRQIGILSQVAPYLTDAAQASMLLELFQPLMRKPTNIVPEKVKTELATIMCSLFPLIPQLSDSTSSAYIKAYTSLSQLFQTLRSRQARLSLIAAFRSLASANTAISALSELMDSLNAYSAKRIDEPDFDRRLAAFTSLNEELYASLSRDDWLPILYNMFNFIQDPTELSIRSNAAFTMKRFIETVANSEDARYEATFMKIFYPGIKNGLRSKNEMVRSEILGVLSYAISQCRRINALQEMQVLLANGDDEASFFNNIHHVQLHRRTRAIRRLGEHCIEGRLHSTVLADIFIPLIGNFIVSGDSVDHTLVNEAITATGRMAGQLKWSAYYSLTQNYLRLSTNKDTSERIHIRALVAILDNFHFTMDEVVEGEEDAGGTITGDGQDETVVDELPTEPRPATAKPSETSRIADAVNLRLLPKLLEHLERRDEAEDSLRIPIAVGVVQVAKHLPTATREPQITRLLTVLSQVFRSKSQETRDLTRETLCRIAIILGPTYLPLILRELRAALLRGPHLHVLAFVTHALLVHVTTGAHAEQFGILDGCVNDVAHVSAEVIFGESGKDVQSDGFKTKMREVRLSAAKGLDSFAITAQYIAPSKISNLLLPIRNILRETESLKILQQIDDLLRRIAGGLNANKHLVPAELLVLCHTLISQNARFLQDAPKPRQTGSKDRQDAIVQTKRKIDSEADHYANNSFRFVSFGLDLFITAHRRSRFDFQDPQIISRLEPMVTTIGNTLYSNRMEVVIPGLKAAAAIVKCPLKSIDEALPVFILQIMDIIRQAGTTESEGVQAAFKSLATILRDRADAQVREKDLVFLLELFSPDLEEPSRQASVFAMLRAIVTRKFVAPEIYDMMDKITEIMVTNQSPHVQELCRGVLLQFLLDYPQGKGRLRDQMTVLAKNLSYVYESGRKSVMEFLSAILAKFQVGVIREYADLLFVALVMVVANDDSPKCREMALELIKSLFSRLNDTQRKVTMSQLHGWAAQYDKPQLTRVSLQVYGVIVDLAQQDISPYIPTILDDANGALQHSAKVLAAAETAAEGGDVAEENLDWQLSYHALVLCSKILRVSPELTTRSDKISWPSVTAHLVFPHGWTRTASCRLLGVLFAATPAAAPSIKLPAESPLSRAGMEDVARKLCVQLQSPNLDAPLSLQIIKNLFYVGKCFAAIEMPASAEQAVAEEVDGEEINAAAAEEDEGPSDAEDDKERHPLPWLFTKLSYQARHAHIARRNKSNSPANWVHQPASVFKWFAAMVSYLESSLAERFLVHILSPLYRIAEDDIIRDTQIGELKTLAIELQDLVQAKVGTTAFAGVYNRIRQGVLGVRRERRNARAVQTATNPGAAAKRKLQQNALKKESRKRKNQVFAGGKGRPKRRREA